MTAHTPDDIRRDLPPDLDEFEREKLVALALRLQAQSPIPPPGFRGGLRRALLGATRSRFGLPHRPSTVRVLVASYVASGLLFLAIAAIGLVGVGPFAAG